jgi:hypothetical protein
MRTAAAVAVLLLVSSAAAAQSVRLHDTTVVEYHGNNGNNKDTDDDYGIGVNKLYLNWQMEATSVSAQIDSVVFSQFPDAGTRNPVPSMPTATTAYADDARIERLTLVHTVADNGTLTLGDSHLQLGRGLALSLRKVDELGTDQALRGGSVGWQGDQFSAMAFAGRTNIANLDGVTQKFMEDPDDTLAGGKLTMHFGRADFSVHGLYLSPSVLQGDPVDHSEDYTALGGAYFEIPATDWLTVYAEGAVEQYRLVQSNTLGSAAYAAADLDLQVVSLLLEGLYLDRFQVMGSPNHALGGTPIRYNQPPTLERIDQEVLDNENVRGGRARISRPFFDGDLVVYVNGMFRQFGRDSAVVDALHGYTGFESVYGTGSRWNLSGGYRQESNLTDPEPMLTMFHGETDWVQELGRGYALHLTVNHESRNLKEPTRGSVDYVRGSTLVGIDYTGLGSLMAEIGYDTFNPTLQNEFLAAIVAWEAADWATVRAVLGSQRGGIKCIGGVCRDFPAFSGGRVEASVYYDLM